MRLCLYLVLLLLLFAISASALVQPDISAIGDFRAFTGNWKDSSGGKTPRNGNLNMSFKELEIAIAGYLNPFAKGWITVSTPGQGFSIEEAYGSIFKGLPFKSEVRAGQFLVDFGKLNMNHAHAFPFVDRPIAERVLLGGDGYIDQGVNWDFLLPTNFYSKVSLSVLKGMIFTANDTSSNPLANRNTQQPVYNGHWNVFVPIGEKGDLDFGVSGLYGRYKGKNAYGTGDSIAGFRNLNAFMGGIDAKYKIKWSDYTSLIVQGEFITNHRDLFDPSNSNFRTISNYAAFAFFDYRFWKRYNVGAMIDRAPGIYDNTTDDYEQNVPAGLSNTARAPLDDKNSTTAYSVYTGFSLLEETTLFRLVARYAKFNIADPSLLAVPTMTSKPGEFSLVLQMIFSMGPHKPHEF